MADFRRWILAFAALVLVLGSVVPASAQNSLNCTVSAAVIPSLRNEGFTELTGDIFLNCVGAPGAHSTPPGSIIPQATLSVSLSAPWTSRILGGASPQALTEAVLLVDDPSPANQDVCLSPLNPAVACDVEGDNGQTFNNPNKFNVYQGLGCSGSGCAPGPNEITFLGVPVDPPATSRTYRITNIRIDATGVLAGQFSTSPVYAYVSVSPSSSITINNPQVIVGLVGPGLSTKAVSNGASLFQCEGFQGTLGTVTFTEAFSTAFKVRGNSGQNTPGVVYYTESGLEIPVVDGETGVADTPTELEATIANIPAGAAISVDAFATSTGQALCTVGSPVGCVNVFSNANLISPKANPTPGSANVVTVADNTKGTSPISVTVVWAITATNPNAIDSLSFNVYGVLKPQTGNPSTLTGAATVQIGFWPQAGSATLGEAIPTFSSTVGVTPAVNLFTIAPCQTILLFPYVTDFTGFDTGLAISNTSLDGLPTGTGVTAGQTGPCSVEFFSLGAVASNIGTKGVVSTTDPDFATVLTSGSVQPGQTWAFSLSSQDPGYPTASAVPYGYAIATCEFQFAHGYSFVSDAAVRNFAAAYLALIIPDAPRAATPFICSTYSSSNSCNLTGEQLVH